MTNKIYSIKLLLILLFLFPLFACEDESFILNDNKLVLPALRERSATHFNNGTRDFYTLISDSNAFNVIYPGTNKSCGYIIRYYFYTNIFLNNDDRVYKYFLDTNKFNKYLKYINNTNNIEVLLCCIFDQYRPMKYKLKRIKDLSKYVKLDKYLKTMIKYNTDGSLFLLKIFTITILINV